MSDVLRINGQSIYPGMNITIDLPLPPLYTHTPMVMPVHIIKGKKPGPVMFISAAIHGDELNGVEIIRRLLKITALKRLRGTLITIPVVNVYGIIQLSRYLPDRRDLNRSFPGSKKGSLASRIADLLMQEIVAKSTHGIDLHTAAIHRSNLPQIRADLSDEQTLAMAMAFNVPVLIDANIRDGSLRGAAAEQGVPMLLYEAGEALRFDEVSIRAGVRGIVGVMRYLGMLPTRKTLKNGHKEPYIAHSSNWIRAPGSGILRTVRPLGSHVKRNEVLGFISDPVSNTELEVKTPYSGLIIGRSEIPLIHEGEAVFHIGRFDNDQMVAEQVESFQVDIFPDADKANDLSIV